MTIEKSSNLIVFCSDEHARRVARCYGDPVVKTPTLDTIARLGTRFTSAYTPSPICVPARASLATGLPVHETGCWSSAQPYHGQHESWMHRLRDAGHPVVSIGKLHFRRGGDDHGFDEEIEPMYLANEGAGWVQGLMRDPMPDYDETIELSREIGPGETSYTEYDRRIAHAATKWIKKYATRFKTRPWVLFVSFVSPHYPLKCPEKFYQMYERQTLPTPPRQRPEHDVLEKMARFWNYDDHFDDGLRDIARKGYYGLVSFLDDNIRQVMEALEDSGAARDTSVMYMSDHGEMLGSHGFWTKSVMYEDSVGVPLMMMGQGIAQSVNTTPVTLNDVAATILRCVGVDASPAREPWMSRPLQDFIAKGEPDRFVLSEYHDGGSPTGITMLRYRNWKYVHYAGGYAPQLFDLYADPQELRDLGMSRAYERERDMLRTLMGHALDPEETNRQAFEDQAKMIKALGGMEALQKMQGFGHTPVG
ncbi:MAG: sulfatase-like hydrolase/transferase [Anderseniella sp.]